MRRSSDIRYPVCSAHSTAALLDRVQCRPPPPLYGCTGDQPPGGEWTGTPPPPPLSTLLQRHSVGNRSWARPLVLSLQLRTQWSVIISKNKTYRDTQQHTERSTACQETENREMEAVWPGEERRPCQGQGSSWHCLTPRHTADTLNPLPPCQALSSHQPPLH